MADDDVRKRAVDDMVQLLAAAEALRDDLDEHAAVCRVIIERLLAGEEVGPTLEEVRSDKLRPKLTDSLTVYERIRHQARLRLIALGVEEGMTSADIQHHWAITRQLASRALQDVRELD